MPGLARGVKLLRNALLSTKCGQWCYCYDAYLSKLELSTELCMPIKLYCGLRGICVFSGTTALLVTYPIRNCHFSYVLDAN